MTPPNRDNESEDEFRESVLVHHIFPVASAATPPAPAMPSSAVIASFGKSSSAAARFSRRCATDEVPGIGRMLIRGAAKEPHERDLHRRAAEALSEVGQDRRLQRGEAAERKERHIRD